MRNKVRILTTVLTAVFCFCGGISAYAYTDEPTDVTEAVIGSVADAADMISGDVTEPNDESMNEPAGIISENELSAFTPDGTGTVLDTATDTDGKQFYTITTEAGNIFYLIIDLEKETNNVYFLNAVTETDLLTLAEKSDSIDTVGSISTNTDIQAPNTSESVEDISEDASSMQTETPAESGNGGPSSLVFILIAVLAIGGVGYYFKIYRPKHQTPDSDDEFDEDEDEYETDGNDMAYSDDSSEYDTDYDELEEYEYFDDEADDPQKE